MSLPDYQPVHLKHKPTFKTWLWRLGLLAVAVGVMFHYLRSDDDPLIYTGHDFDYNSE